VVLHVTKWAAKLIVIMGGVFLCPWTGEGDGEAPRYGLDPTCSLGIQEAIIKCTRSRVLVTHAYNPSYSGCRDQEDRQFKASPGQIVCEILSQKTLHKKGMVE
jgi:hypothetical protein